MNRYLGILSASTATFAATNIDDAFLLTFFFARRIPTRRIVVGQYVGFAAIIGVSMIGARAALAIPHRWIHLLGVLPIALGIRHLFQARRTDKEQDRANDPPIGKESFVSIALLTFSNGADNISVYIPFFVIGRDELWLVLIVYAALVALWCFVARLLGNHAPILRFVDRWGDWAATLVFVGLGIYILSS